MQQKHTYYICFTDNFQKFTEAYLEPCQTSKKELIVKTIDGFKPLKNPS